MAAQSSILGWRIPMDEGAWRATVPGVTQSQTQLSTAQVVLVVKNPPVNTADKRDLGSIPGLGRSPRGENGNPLQFSCLENYMDRGAWRATVHGLQRIRHD